jgi:hypothetical protein
MGVEVGEGTGLSHQGEVWGVVKEWAFCGVVLFAMCVVCLLWGLETLYIPF